MATVYADTIVSHWDNMVPGMQVSSNDFYTQVERSLGDHHLEGLKLERVNLRQGGVLSAKREYLQVRRSDNVFHVCAAPFGNGFFVSWWLGRVERGFFAMLARIPVLGFLLKVLFKPLTYYKIDTTLMLQSITHGAVLSTLDAMTSAKGVRAPSEFERKPIMRDFFEKLK
ncbi:MAG: hypothetical protein IVW54_18490 [Candidatus Binataceae bacterium]|nr:hypothetical protein [Candidatus Binataceae bacterium]